MNHVLNDMRQLLNSLDLCQPFGSPNEHLSMCSATEVCGQVLELIADAAIAHAVDCHHVQPLM